MGFVEELKRNRKLIFCTLIVSIISGALIIYANPAILENSSITEITKGMHHYDSLAFKSEWKDTAIIYTGYVFLIGFSAIWLLIFAWLISIVKIGLPQNFGILAIALLLAVQFGGLDYEDVPRAVSGTLAIIAIGNLFDQKVIWQVISFALRKLVALSFVAVLVTYTTVSFIAGLKVNGLPLIVDWVFPILFVYVVIDELARYISIGIKELRNLRKSFSSIDM